MRLIRILQPVAILNDGECGSEVAATPAPVYHQRENRVLHLTIFNPFETVTTHFEADSPRGPDEGRLELSD